MNPWLRVDISLDRITSLKPSVDLKILGKCQLHFVYLFCNIAGALFHNKEELISP